MSKVLLKRPSLLAYPGISPGFDPTHPASELVRFSAVSRGRAYGDLLTHKTSAITGSTTATIDSALGVCGNFAGTNGDLMTGQTTTNDVSITMAAIVRSTTISGTTKYGIFGTGNGAGGYSLAFRGANFIYITNDSTTNPSFTSTPISVAVNVPYFVAVSYTGLTGGTVNFVLTNLNTGQIYTYTTTATLGATAAPSGTVFIGSDGNALDFFIGNIAAVMFNGNFMHMQQLTQWAADPWSFWYPTTYDMGFELTTPTVGGGSTLMPQIWM